MKTLIVYNSEYLGDFDLHSWKQPRQNISDFVELPTQIKPHKILQHRDKSEISKFKQKIKNYIKEHRPNRILFCVPGHLEWDENKNLMHYLFEHKVELLLH